MIVVLDGHSLTPESLYDLGMKKSEAKVSVSEKAWDRIRAARKVIDEILESGRIVYGINTGFGKFESTIIKPQQLADLQINLIRSHCAGVGEPLPPHRARMMMALRLNILAKGHSGIRPSSVQVLIDAFNSGVVPYIPVQGTVGASGDLAPLSHLALGMCGEGKLATLDDPTWRPAAQVLDQFGIKPIHLEAKEGLALINGTQFIASLGCEAIVRARRACLVADAIAAMTYESLQCTNSSLNPLIHNARPHAGQREVAARIRSLLHSEKYPSQIKLGHENCGRVQDAYSIRCAPQVHGICNDTVKFVERVMMTELNCATDNPLVFPGTQEKIISGGNFHGEYPAKILDMLAIGIHELSSISERRIERLNNPSLSHLPAFLIKEGGLNSGFMIAHCTAAALVSENKVLCHPASVDTISTSAAQEDHVSMGGFSARKAIQVVENVERVLAIELLCACQGIDFLRPKKSTEPLERLLSLVRSEVHTWTRDRDVSIDMNRIHDLIRSGAVWNTVKYAVPQECHFAEQPIGSVMSKL